MGLKTVELNQMGQQQQPPPAATTTVATTTRTNMQGRGVGPKSGLVDLTQNKREPTHNIGRHGRMIGSISGVVNVYRACPLKGIYI